MYGKSVSYILFLRIKHLTNSAFDISVGNSVHSESIQYDLQTVGYLETKHQIDH